MKKICLFIFALACFTQLSAQLTPLNTFNKRTLFKYWDPDYPQAGLQQTTDRGYLSPRMAFDSIGGSQIHFFDFVKRNREGNTVWIKRVLMGADHAGIQRMEAGADAIQTTDGGYIGAMMLYKDSVHGETVLLKTDSLLNLLWAKKYPGEQASSPLKIRQTADNGYVVAGYTMDNGNRRYAFIFKTDASGNYAWGKKCVIGNDSDARFRNVIELPGHGYLACGYSGKHALLVKFDLNGNMNWSRNFFYQYGSFDGLALTSDNELMVGGYYADSTIAYGRGCFLKLDTAGNISWFKSYNQNPTPYYGSNILCLQARKGYVVFAGYLSDPIPSTIIGRIDNIGTLGWTQKYYNTYHTFNYEPMALINTSDGGLALDEFTGTFFNGISNFSKELMKTDSLGNGACDGGSHLITIGTINYAQQPAPAVSASGAVINYATSLIDGLYTDSTVCGIINDPAPAVGIIARTPVIANLAQNIPNPWTDETSISYTLSHSVNTVTFEIYNALGVCVRKQKENPAAGEHAIRVQDLGKGIYFYLLDADGARATRKMLVE